MQQRASKKQLLSSSNLALNSSIANVNELSGPALVQVETGLMSAAETGQMSAAETGQMSAVETRQMSTIATGRCPILILYICLFSTCTSKGRKAH